MTPMNMSSILSHMVVVEKTYDQKRQKANINYTRWNEYVISHIQNVSWYTEMLTTINPESYAGICWDIPLAIEELEAEQGNPERVLQNQRFKSLFVGFKCND